MRSFVQTLFRIDTKMMLDFVKKSNFAQKRKTVPQESLLFRGNPSFTERGKRSEYAKNVKEIE